MYLRLIPTASYSRLLPCDIAYMAFRVDMGKFRWGFNRFGQLGLGLCVSGQTRNRSYPHTISPRRVVHFPGSVAFANAAANPLQQLEQKMACCLPGVREKQDD